VTLLAERSLRSGSVSLSMQENDARGGRKGHRCDDSAVELAHRRWQLDAACFDAGLID
jgi:hypothetical protein